MKKKMWLSRSYSSGYYCIFCGLEIEPWALSSEFCASCQEIGAEDEFMELFE